MLHLAVKCTRNVSIRSFRDAKRLFSMPASTAALTPDEVVAALDKHIVGQSEAKVATAIALRDQWRRQKLDTEWMRETLPNNILMIGPTGVGKTEVARRLARLANAPFVNVEATKFTEVGIYGTDTDSMVSDLVDNAVQQAEERAREAERPAARERAIDRLVSAIGWKDEAEREAIRQDLREGKRDQDLVDVSLPRRGGRGSGLAGLPPALGNLLGSIGGGGRAGNSSLPAGVISIGMPKEMAGKFRRGGARSSGVVVSGSSDIEDFFKDVMHNAKDADDSDGSAEDGEDKEKVKVEDALLRLEDEELEHAMDGLDLNALAIHEAEQRGIIFVDEIDKLVRRDGTHGGGSVSKGEGVQKELLALLEGTTVRTEKGLVSTRHILFICAGAFHQSKPSDLLPELQGRLPVRVELQPLTEEDFVRILSSTEYSLLLQQTKLMETEGVQLAFTDDAVREIARLAAQINATVENIGARRLRTVISTLMEETSFNAHRLNGTTVTVDADYVRRHTGDIANKVDVQKYVL